MLSILVDPEKKFVDEYYNHADGETRKFSPWSPALLEDDVWLNHLAKTDYVALLRQPVTLDRVKRGKLYIQYAIERIRGWRPYAALQRRAGQHG
jgi:hypothetical protein